MKARKFLSLIAMMIATWTVWSVCAAPVVKLSEVVSREDLEAEVAAKIAEIEVATASEDAYQAAKGKLHQTTAQLSVLCQALAESDVETKTKSTAALMRDRALEFGHPSSLDQARQLLNSLKAASEFNANPTAKLEYNWAKLAGKRTLMDSLRERTDQVRKSMRRPKDAVVEGRHASVMAVLALAIAAQADELPNAADRPLWTDWSLELQREMTLTAAAIRSKDAPTVLEHFKAAQTACDRCHEKFKR